MCLPAFTGEAGQSARGRSSPLNLSLAALHSLPSGINSRCLPAALAILTPFQSYSACVPPAATAALHAADTGLSGPSAKHADTRLTGSVSEPWASAGVAASPASANGAKPRATIPAALRRAVMEGSPSERHNGGTPGPNPSRRSAS
ncbi:hypothetical protein SMICM304S_00650 [Streptomyces microflavus]